MTWWWIGNVVLAVVVLPVVIALLNRVLAAVDDIAVAAGALDDELAGVPDALAETDRTIENVSVGAVRYAGSVGTLLG